MVQNYLLLNVKCEILRSLWAARYVSLHNVIYGAFYDDWVRIVQASHAWR